MAANPVQFRRKQNTLLEMEPSPSATLAMHVARDRTSSCRMLVRLHKESRFSRAATSLINYAKKWDGMHTARTDREWHITWGMLAQIAGPYLRMVRLKDVNRVIKQEN